MKEYLKPTIEVFDIKNDDVILTSGTLKQFNVFKEEGDAEVNYGDLL